MVGTTPVTARRTSLWGAAMLVVAACGATTAIAQGPPQQAAFSEVFKAPTPAESLEEPIATKLADRLGKVWHASADRTCVAEKKLDAASYAKLARAMLIAVGEHMQALAASALDPKKADADFEANAGAGAIRDVKRLASDPKVMAFLKLWRLGQSVEQTSSFLDNIERALLLARIQTQAKASPVATGDDPELLIELETIAGAPLEYFDANQSPEMTRFFELMIAAGDALTSASNQDALLAWGPGKLLPLLEPALKEHCIAKP